MKKVYYLPTCSTCKRIIKELDLKTLGFEFQDIKSNPITEEQLDFLCNKSGSYESLFSRVARKYKELGLKDQSLTENDYKEFILGEYTFLKRPVIIFNNSVFIGNSKKVVEAASKALK